MGIFSFVGKAYNAVKNAFTGGASQTATAGMNFPLRPGIKLDGTPQPTASKLAIDAAISSGGLKVISQPSGGFNVTPTINSALTPVPTTISSGRSSNNNLGSSTTPSGSPTIENTPTTINSRMSVDTLGGASSSTSGTTSGAGTPITMPGASNTGGAAANFDIGSLLTPSLANLGWTIQNGKLVAPSEKDATKSTDTYSKENLGKWKSMLKDLLPQPESQFDEYKQLEQDAQLQQKKDTMNALTARLNDVTATRDSQLLQLRGIGAKEGVTETVYGGQQAEINREAAIKSLPIAAQLSAAQNDYQTAQEHVDKYFSILSADSTAQYNYQKSLISSVMDYADKEEQRKLNLLDKAVTRQQQLEDDNLSKAWSLVNSARESGQTGVMTSLLNMIELARTTNTPIDMGKLTEKAGQITPKAKEAEQPSMTGQTLALGSNAKESQAVVEALGKQGITSGDIVSLQSYLKQGYSLEQIAKMTNMPAPIQAAFAQYISVPKLGSALTE